MDFFNLMLCVLYKHYRRNNESIVAAFHSKMAISVTLVGYFFDISMILTRVLKWGNFELNIPSSKILIGLIVVMPFGILVHLVTLKHDQLDSYELSDTEYKNGWFYFIIFAVIPVFLLFYLPGKSEN